MPQQATTGHQKDKCGSGEGTGAGYGIPPRWDPFAMDID